MLKDIKSFRNGLVYGVTLIVPGVSATIFAVMLGFYDELIHKMNHFREDYRKNTKFFAIFVLGIISGAVIFSSVIMFLLANVSLPAMAFFMGLLLGIVPFIYSKATAGSNLLARREALLAVIALVALVLLSQSVDTIEIYSGDAVNDINTSLVLYIFIAGIIGGATLVVPGLSGAFILLVMGLYPLIINATASIGMYVTDISNVELLGDILLTLLPFTIGALVGCLSMARLMERLFRDFNKSVHAVILGFLVGSVIVLPMDPIVYQSGTSPMMIIAGIITLCLGCAASYMMKKKL